MATWDQSRGELVGGHRWLTPDLILFESVISAPFGGGRLTEPYALFTGDSELVAAFPKRPPIERAEMVPDLHPVELAYEKLKSAVRAERAK